MTCPLCDTNCAGADLESLVGGDLDWLWTQLADAADRKGDPILATGSTTVTVAHGVPERTAAAGLLGRRHLSAGQRIRVDLSTLADRISPLTPGAVAAHAAGRRLAQRAADRAARATSENQLRQRLTQLLPDAGEDDAWASLRRLGWVTRILAAEDPTLLERAAAVIDHLPEQPQQVVDRRVLAQTATRDPHALDRGKPVGGLALALLITLGRCESTTPRQMWASVGVSYDDITGGLTALGIAPHGWTVPDGAPVTLPPRVLATCAWPEGADATVFVTENPSVLSAATEIAGAQVICTSGTPSAVEVGALARLAAGGWRLLVRADFDDAGINHVRSILDAAPTARPWRMSATDYESGVAAGDAIVELRLDRIGDTPWDAPLAAAMRNHGRALYEESLLDRLLRDVRSR